jgi:hypothetical protein
MIDKTLKHTFIGLFVMILSVVATWSIAVFTIARHCEMVGNFFVSNKVFECKLKE